MSALFLKKDIPRRGFLRTLLKFLGISLFMQPATYLVGHFTMKKHGSFMAAGAKAKWMCTLPCILYPPQGQACSPVGATTTCSNPDPRFNRTCTCINIP